MNPYFNNIMVEEHQRFLRSLGARPRLDRDESRERRTLRKQLARLVRSRPIVPAQSDREVTIRGASHTDAAGLAMLADLSEQRLPAGPVLVAQIDSRLVAALPVNGGPVLTDIRHPTADVVQLLELRSEQLRRCTETGKAA